VFALGKKLLELLFAYKTEENKGKNPLRSKTIWNGVIGIAIWAADKWLGVNISTGDALVILSTINIILRLVTKSPVGFYELEEK